MIYSPGNNKEVNGVYAMQGAKELAFVALYVGARLFWQLVRSCYGTGIWIPEKPWLDNDSWKDNR